MNRVANLRGSIATCIANWQEIQLAPGECFIHTAKAIVDLSTKIKEKLANKAGIPVQSFGTEVVVYDQNNVQITRVDKGDMFGGTGTYSMENNTLVVRLIRLGGAGKLQFGGVKYADLTTWNAERSKAIENPYTLYLWAELRDTEAGENEAGIISNEAENGGLFDNTDGWKDNEPSSGDYYFADTFGNIYFFRTASAIGSRVILQGINQLTTVISEDISVADPSRMTLKQLIENVLPEYASYKGKITTTSYGELNSRLYQGKLLYVDEDSFLFENELFALDSENIPEDSTRLYKGDFVFYDNNAWVRIPLGELIAENNSITEFERADDYAIALYAQADAELKAKENNLKDIIKDLYKTKADVDPVTKKIVSSLLPDSVLGGTKYEGAITLVDLGYETGEIDDNPLENGTEYSTIAEIKKHLFQIVDPYFDYDGNQEFEGDGDDVDDDLFDEKLFERGMYFVFSGKGIYDISQIVDGWVPLKVRHTTQYTGEISQDDYDNGAYHTAEDAKNVAIEEINAKRAQWVQEEQALTEPDYEDAYNGAHNADGLEKVLSVTTPEPLDFDNGITTERYDYEVSKDVTVKLAKKSGASTADEIKDIIADNSMLLMAATPEADTVTTHVAADDISDVERVETATFSWEDSNEGIDAASEKLAEALGDTSSSLYASLTAIKNRAIEKINQAAFDSIYAQVQADVASKGSRFSLASTEADLRNIYGQPLSIDVRAGGHIEVSYGSTVVLVATPTFNYESELIEDKTFDEDTYRHTATLTYPAVYAPSEESLNFTVPVTYAYVNRSGSTAISKSLITGVSEISTAGLTYDTAVLKEDYDTKLNDAYWNSGDATDRMAAVNGLTAKVKAALPNLSDIAASTSSTIRAKLVEALAQNMYNNDMPSIFGASLSYCRNMADEMLPDVIVVTPSGDLNSYARNIQDACFDYAVQVGDPNYEDRYSYEYTISDADNWVLSNHYYREGLINYKSFVWDANGKKNIGPGDWLVYNGKTFDLVDHTEEFNQLHVSSLGGNSGDIVYDPTITGKKRTVNASGLGEDSSQQADIIEVDVSFDNESQLHLESPRSILYLDRLLREADRFHPTYYNGKGTIASYGPIEFKSRGMSFSAGPYTFEFGNQANEGSFNVNTTTSADAPTHYEPHKFDEILDYIEANNLLDGANQEVIDAYNYEDSFDVSGVDSVYSNFETKKGSLDIPNIVDGTVATSEYVDAELSRLEKLVVALSKLNSSKGDHNFLQTLDANGKLNNSKIEQIPVDPDDPDGKVAGFKVHRDMSSPDKDVVDSTVNHDLMMKDDLSDVGDYGKSKTRAGEDGYGLHTNPNTEEPYSDQLTPQEEEIVHYLPNHSGVLLNDNSIIDCGEWLDEDD